MNPVRLALIALGLLLASVAGVSTWMFAMQFRLPPLGRPFGFYLVAQIGLSLGGCWVVVWIIRLVEELRREARGHAQSIDKELSR